MNLLQALHLIKLLDIPVLTTNDVATLLKVSQSNASHILSKLSKTNEMFKLGKGIWGITGRVDSLALAGYLCAPMPAYISLHTALHIHGLIEQIPEVIYAVSFARTSQYHTNLATISVHHIHQDLFFGYEIQADPMIKIATPEKALIDYLYLKPAKSKIFTSLPEVDLESIDLALLTSYIDRIPYKKRQVMVRSRLEQLLDAR